MQTEWYCLAVHRNTRKHALEYVGVEKHVTERVGFYHLFLSSSFPLTSIADKLKQLWNYFTQSATSLSL